MAKLSITKFLLVTLVAISTLFQLVPLSALAQAPAPTPTSTGSEDIIIYEVFPDLETYYRARMEEEAGPAVARAFDALTRATDEANRLARDYRDSTVTVYGISTPVSCTAPAAAFSPICMEKFQKAELARQRQARSQQKFDEAYAALNRADAAARAGNKEEFDKAIDEAVKRSAEGVNAAEEILDLAKYDPKTVGATCTFSSTFSLLECFKIGLSILGAVALKVASWFVYFCAQVLNWAVDNTIINLKRTLAGLGSIDAVWKTFRDIGNLFFIFIILYVGIRTILGQSGRVGGLIRNVIIIALFINFSIFATKVFIDFTNVVAVGIYNEIKKSPTSGMRSDDVAEPFMEALNLSTLYKNNTSFDIGDTGDQEWYEILLVGIFGTAFLILLGMSLLAAAIVLLYRFFVIIVLLAFSSFAFLTYAIPNFSQLGRWWKALLNEAIFAPVWMLFLYATLQVINNLGAATSGNSFLDLFKAPPGSSGTTWGAFSVVGNFVIILFLLNGGTVIARTLSVRGADRAEKIARAVPGKLFGTPLRGTVGNAARIIDAKLGNISNNKFGLRGKVYNQLIGNSVLGRAVRGATVGAVAKTTFGSGSSSVEVNKLREDIKKSQKETERKYQVETIKQSIADRVKKLKGLNPADAGFQTERRELGKELNKLNNKELEKLGKDVLTDSNVLDIIDRRAFDHLVSSASEISEGDKDKLRESRLNKLRGSIGLESEDPNTFIPNAQQREFIEKYIRETKAEDLMDLGSEILTNYNFVKYINPGKLKDMETLPVETRVGIARQIISQSVLGGAGGRAHKAYAYITKPENVDIWPVTMPANP